MTQSKLKKRRIDTHTEKRILTGMIVSTEFLINVVPVLQLTYFQSNYGRTVAKWCLEFFDVYEQAPFDHIKDIFKQRTDELHDQADLVKALLIDISDKYELDKGLNAPYMIDKALEFFKKRELEITSGNMQILLGKNDLEGAEEQILQFNKIARISANWSNPFDVEHIKDVFKEEDRLLRLTGDLGRYMGAFDRGWLIGVAAGFKMGKCLSGDSMVLLANGEWKSVKDIVTDKDRDIIALNEQGKFVKGVISNHYINGNKPVYRVTTRLGHTVNITTNHPLLTLMDGWKQLRKLKVGDRIAVPRSIPFFGTNHIEEHKLRYLAYMIADGNFSHNVFTKQEVSIQEDFKRCVELFGDRCSSLKHDPICFSVGKTKDRNSLLKSRTNEWLDEIGVDKCISKNKSLPPVVMELNKEDLSLFLSVLFTCDGSIFSKKGDPAKIGIEYCSASQKLILQIKHLLLRFGVVTRYVSGKVLLNGKEHDKHTLAIHNKEYLLKFIHNIGFLFSKDEKVQECLPLIEAKPNARNLIDLFHGVGEKVLSKCKDVKGIYSEKKLLGQSMYKNGGLSRSVLSRIGKATGDKWIQNAVNSDVLWDEIKKIERVGIQPTYDLTVDDFHCFVANDVVVHNTWCLQEFAMEALFKKLKVAFISLEMHERDMFGRIYKRLVGAGETEGGEAIYPCFDCYLNQADTCDKEEREIKVALLDEEGDKPKDFDPDSDYRPCTFCKDNPAFKREYAVATWFEKLKRPPFNESYVTRHLESIEKVYGKYLMFKKYPRFSANVTDVMRDLDVLEKTDGFIPDMIVIDYADILKPEDSTASSTSQLDDTWKTLSRLAGERHAIVVTASQVNRGALNKKQVEQQDLAMWIGKLGHVDAMYSLNQTPTDKRNGVMHVGTMVKRFEEFDAERTCTIIQNLKYGQMCLDSHY
jgi:intein/homing endonuclease